MAGTGPFLLIRLALGLLAVLAVAACDTLTPSPPDEPRPEPRSCSLTNNELELAEASWEELGLACLVVEHPSQGRAEMHYDPTLGALARARARDMAERGYYGGEGREYPPHVDHDGFGPDHYLCEASYHQRYCHPEVPFANSVESIAMRGAFSPWGDEVPAEALTDYAATLEQWLGSPGHRRHLLAEAPYFAEGTRYGVGHAVGDYEGEAVDEAGNPVLVRGKASFWVFIAAVPPHWELD